MHKCYNSSRDQFIFVSHQKAQRTLPSQASGGSFPHAVLRRRQKAWTHSFDTEVGWFGLVFIPQRAGRLFHIKGLNEQEIKTKHETKALTVIKAIHRFVGHTFPEVEGHCDASENKIKMDIYRVLFLNFCFCIFTPPHPISESKCQQRQKLCSTWILTFSSVKPKVGERVNETRKRNLQTVDVTDSTSFCAV